MAKVLIVAANTRSLVDNRGDLIAEIRDRGHEVEALIPEQDFDKDKLSKVEIDNYELFFLDRQKINPFFDIKSLLELRYKIKNSNPDFVFLYTIKPIIYGSIAARLAKVKNIFSMVTGLGYLFIGNSSKHKILQNIALFLYKLAFLFNEKVFMQNYDDIEMFEKKNIIQKSKVVKTNGSGVNTSFFSADYNYPEDPSFLLIARLIKDKGIFEFVEAAQELKKNNFNIEARFKILGSYDSNPSSISQNEVQKWEQENVIEYLGSTKDVRPYIKNSDVLVLPSYREGTPRAVLEAMSMARPIITTNAPGCRETVKDGYNGFLVKVRDSESLKQAMERFIEKPELICEMDKNSRKIAEEKYDVRKVNNKIIKTMGL